MFHVDPNWGYMCTFEGREKKSKKKIIRKWELFEMYYRWHKKVFLAR